MLQFSISTRIYILVVLLFSNWQIAQSQIKYLKQNFEYTRWATVNHDSLFFKSDTVRLLRLDNDVSPTNSDSMDLAGFYGNKDFMFIFFNNANEFQPSAVIVESWSIIRKKGNFLWNFNRSKQVLTLNFNNKICLKYKPILEKGVKIKSSYVGHAPFQSTELLLKRLN
ncbi:MAG: hypothetical protein C5B52_05105 [Bacteroidetes bacterium]|nr:MAG: hypothetical protein C5B52_05105 [Bacteroidota bacterium]